MKCNIFFRSQLIALTFLGFSAFAGISAERESVNMVVNSENYSTTPLYKNRAVPIFMMVVGVGMIGMWSADMASGKFSGQGNFFRWREGENMLWPHIAAEFLTGAGLVAGGIGLYAGKDWALAVSMISLGAVAYSAINSTGWVLAEKSRIAYGIPMWVSLTGAVVSMVILIN